MQSNEIPFVSIEYNSIKVRVNLLSVVLIQFFSQAEAQQASKHMKVLNIPGSADFPLRAFSAECL